MAIAFFNVLLGQYEIPKKIVTDQLGSYASGKASIPKLEGVKHVFVKSDARLNNRVENSHQPTRRREVALIGFKSQGQAQSFLSGFDVIRGHVRPKKHVLCAMEYRVRVREALLSWVAITMG